MYFKTRKGGEGAGGGGFGCCFKGEIIELEQPLSSNPNS